MTTLDWLTLIGELANRLSVSTEVGRSAPLQGPAGQRLYAAVFVDPQARLWVARAFVDDQAQDLYKGPSPIVAKAAGEDHLRAAMPPFTDPVRRLRRAPVIPVEEIARSIERLLK